jgi:CHAD domain-containing protein
MARAKQVAGLTADTTYRQAIGAVIETRFNEMWAHRDGTLLGRDPEELHDMRVGSRRLRAAMDVAVECFPSKYAYYHDTVKELTDVLGGVRDMDVMRERLVAYRNSRPPDERPTINRLIANIRTERDARRIELIAFFHRLDVERFDVRFRGFMAEHSRG